MTKEGMIVRDPATNEEVFMSYSDMEQETVQTLLHPVGGFCYPIDSFLMLDLPRVPYYIKDWLPKMGKAILYAPPKSGKSFLTLQIARCIGAGIPIFGIPTSQGRVLIIQFELGHRVLQQRIASTGKSYPNVYVATTFSMKIDTTAGREQLLTAVNGVRPDVLMFDPLYKMVSGDENDARDMCKVTDVLDEVIEAFGCSVFVIHHPGKDITKGGRGSSIFEGWVDSYIQMKRISKDGEPLKAKITPKLLRHAELPPEPITIEMKNFEFVRVDAPLTVKGEVAAFIKSKATMGEPATRADILNAGVGSNASVQDALNALVEEGKADRVRRGEYFWKGGS